MKGKYYFTQLSAPIIGLAAMFFFFALAGKLHIIETDNINFLDLIVISAIFLTVPVTMVIWGKFLVLFGILNRDEARGYPWSKPWKENAKKT